MWRPPADIDGSGIIHLDNAATSWPKPAEILDRALEWYRAWGVNPGRSGSDIARIAGVLVDDTRAALATFFGAQGPERVVFTGNATDALNLAFAGLIRAGDHVIATEADHNAVIRPLNHLARERGISFDFAPVGEDGYLDPEEIYRRLRPNTRVVTMTHASNVTGAVQPAAEIGRWCRERELYFVLDAAQSAGLIDIDMEALAVDALAFTGHKSMLAAPGIGGLCLSRRCEPRPSRFGGTGVHSAEPFQPDFLPVRLEAGTLNFIGVAALLAALGYLQERPPAETLAHELALIGALQDGFGALPHIHQLGTRNLDNRVPVLCFAIDGIAPAAVGERLDIEHNIVVRTGLHCAPLMHRRLGTFPDGAVRISPGHATTRADIDHLLAALSKISARH